MERSVIASAYAVYKELFGKEEMLRVLPWLIQSGLSQAVNASMIY